MVSLAVCASWRGFWLLVHSLVLCGPAHLTYTAFLLQLVEACPCAAVTLY